MKPNLFGHAHKKTTEIKLKLFCEESGSKDWLYMGVLIVPEEIEQRVLEKLMNLRCGHPDGDKIWSQCDNKCPRHKNNDTEVHYVNIDSKDKFFIAEKWINYLLNDTEDIYFYVLGLDFKKLDMSRFGNKGQQHNIYSRFFRTVILKAVKSYFYRYNSIVIKDIYHDNSNALETHYYFSWHPIFYIGSRDDKVTLACDNIKFIDSDHRKSKNSYSNFIQLMDVLLGCINNCLDYTSKNKEKVAIAEKCLPLIERLIEKPENRFFPKIRSEKCR
jgi:hypothetical protein